MVGRSYHTHAPVLDDFPAISHRRCFRLRTGNTGRRSPALYGLPYPLSSSCIGRTIITTDEPSLSDWPDDLARRPGRHERTATAQEYRLTGLSASATAATAGDNDTEAHV